LIVKGVKVVKRVTIGGVAKIAGIEIGTMRQWADWILDPWPPW
jgi:hypothetical protein